jgi:hypothetical protein
MADDALREALKAAREQREPPAAPPAQQGEQTAAQRLEAALNRPRTTENKES